MKRTKFYPVNDDGTINEQSEFFDDQEDISAHHSVFPVYETPEPAPNQKNVNRKPSRPQGWQRSQSYNNGHTGSACGSRAVCRR